MQQNSFSEYDYNCPLHKTLGMMKAICKFYDGCQRVILETQRSDAKLSMATIETLLSSPAHNKVLDEINKMKFMDPVMDKHQMQGNFDTLHNNLDMAFDKIAKNPGRK